ATDKDDNYVICFTDNPQLLDVIRSLSAFSYIGFSWTTNDYYGAGPVCGNIDSSSQSFYIPDLLEEHKDKNKDKD
ncbi:MAG TPA: hypothetical protein VJ998_00715, partial [Pseudomonadales bacterium]|nr:hypothetical protein [Pseudomonadales bacterium]